MILQFSVSNFRCFRKRQTLNLMASSQDKELLGNCIAKELPGLRGKLWSKGVALYGANASGKTTTLGALEALAEMVKHSAKMTDPKEPIPQIEPYVLCPGGTDVPTGFSVVFVAEEIRYEYRVAATRERVWHESLRAFPNKKEQVWFNRDWDEHTGSYTWSPDKPTGFKRDPKLEGYTLSNMLFLSKAVASNRTELEPVFRFFKEKLKFLDLSARSALSNNFTLKQIDAENSHSGQIINMLRHAGLGVTMARAVERRPPAEELESIAKGLPIEMLERFREKKWTEPELMHLGQGKVEVALPWALESLGTHRFFQLAGPWLDILENGYIACIDELETSMHPLMVRELLRLFFSDTENTKGAQILFTTHNPLMLDATLIRRDQVWFTEKDPEGEAHLYPLTDFSPRKGESLVRGYLSGRYGAVPFVPDGLLGTFKVEGASFVSEPDLSEGEQDTYD